MATALKPQVQSIFVTPVCTHFLAVAQEANAGWKPLILERMQAKESKPKHGLGWRSTLDFESWGGLHAQTLFRVLRELANNLTATRGGGRVELDWRISACAVVRQNGEHGEICTRPGGFWSGVYYVDDGYAKSDDVALGGELILSDPRGPAPAMVAPDLAFRVPGGLTAGLNETIRPKSGMILLFPSWIPCGEKRYDGANHRITIEFDLAPPVS
jgi:Putative 2OG-Fe(II) oxygenase